MSRVTPCPSVHGDLHLSSCSCYPEKCIVVQTRCQIYSLPNAKIILRRSCTLKIITSRQCITWSYRQRPMLAVCHRNITHVAFYDAIVALYMLLLWPVNTHGRLRMMCYCLLSLSKAAGCCSWYRMSTAVENSNVLLWISHYLDVRCVAWTHKAFHHIERFVLESHWWDMLNSQHT